MKKFTVVVGNVGTVLETENEEQAWERYSSERARSRFEDGARSFLEPVSLLADGDVLAEWNPPEHLLPEDGESAAPTVLDALHARHGMGDVHLIEPGYRDDPEDMESGGSIGFSSLGNLPKDGGTIKERALRGELLALVPSACSGSDYNGGALARSNVRALRELAESEGLVHFELSGAHGSHGIAFPLWERSAELVSILEGLEDYPVVDEDAMAEEESSDEEQAWESWIRHDFAKELESATGIDVSEVSDKDLRELFFSRMSESGRYFEHSDEGPHVDVEELAEGITREDLRALEGAVSNSQDEEDRALAIAEIVSRTMEPAVQVLHGDESTDRLPAVEALEACTSELEALGVYDRDGIKLGSALGVLRQIADWPIPSELPILKDGSEIADALEGFAKRLREPHSAAVVSVDLEALAKAFRDGTGYRSSSTPLGAFRELRKQVETVRDAARENVLPMLAEGSSPYNRAARAEAWGRDPSSGLLVAEHRRRELQEAWSAYCRSRDPKSRRTFILPTETESKLLALGLEARDAVRSHVLDRIADELRQRMGSGSGRGVLGGTAGGWEDVLEVDRASGIVRTSPRGEHGAARERKLEDFESLLRV